jgi:cellulose synthase operon protein C
VTARAILAVVAVAALAWLGVLLRDARLAAPGSASATDRAAASEDAPGAIDGLRRALLLNPDSQLDVYRARLELAARRPQESLRTAEALVAREPENIDGWVQVWAAAVNTRDRARARAALAEIKRLNPLLRLPG